MYFQGTGGGDSCRSGPGRAFGVPAPSPKVPEYYFTHPLVCTLPLQLISVAQPVDRYVNLVSRRECDIRAQFIRHDRQGGR